MELARRDMVKGAAAAMGAGMMLAGSTALADEADASQQWDREADIVVVGAGMGGLCAGLKALDNGVENVTIVEISKWLGGGSSFSAGVIHVGMAGQDRETFDSYTGHLGVDMGYNALMDMSDMLQWLADKDLPMQIADAGETAGAGLEAQSVRNAPRGIMLAEDGTSGTPACHNFFDAMGKAFTDAGGTLLTETHGKHIFQNDKGEVCGILCADKDGNPIRIKTTQVILACGSYQNDEELKTLYLGRDGNHLAVAGSPYNTGAGIKMARECGGSVQGDMSKFTGIWMAARPAKNWMEDVEAYEEHGYDDEPGGKWFNFNICLDRLAKGSCIYVNADGKRYIDEEKCSYPEKNAGTVRQPRGTAIMVCDSVSMADWRELATYSTAPTIGDKLDIITSDEVGGSLYEADTLEDLADQLNASGIATHRIVKSQFLRTVQEYNDAVQSGEGDDLFPTASGDGRAPIAEPPFYAFPFRNASYCMYGGVAINEKCQVLDVARKPIRGLYAVSPCAGGLMYEYYVGSITFAGVTGRWAADSAAEALQQQA